MIEKTVLDIRQDVPLAPFTTLGLGGPARFFASCRSDADILDGMNFARKRGLRLLVLGGGSNLLVADGGFDGLVLHLVSRGIVRDEAPDGIHLTVAAGEPWDDFVCSCIDQGLTGIECLSGIPGLVGATPIQNVGAYGQEVSQTILSVSAIDLRNGEDMEFRNADCRFGYRQSRFKQEDAGRYAVTSVTFLLQPGGRPVIHYPELKKHLASTAPLDELQDGKPVLQAVRNGVLALRRRKSMVLDPADPNARSAGSFFTNPMVPQSVFEQLKARFPALPSFPAEEGIKIPAAWLVEQAGFTRGYRLGGAAVSDNHCLALVNRGTTTQEMLALAEKIRQAVKEKFGLFLDMEPVVAGEVA